MGFNHGTHGIHGKQGRSKDRPFVFTQVILSEAKDPAEVAFPFWIFNFAANDKTVVGVVALSTAHHTPPCGHPSQEGIFAVAD